MKVNCVPNGEILIKQMDVAALVTVRGGREGLIRSLSWRGKVQMYTMFWTSIWWAHLSFVDVAVFVQCRNSLCWFRWIMLDRIERCNSPFGPDEKFHKAVPTHSKTGEKRFPFRQFVALGIVNALVLTISENFFFPIRFDRSESLRQRVKISH